MKTPPEIDNSHSLIPLPDGSLAITPPEAKRILSGMIGDSLALARQELDASERAEEFFEKGNECYYSGRGTPADQAEAVSWYLKAAGLGHTHAQYYLGQCYAEGLGVPVDTVEADKWFKLAAEQGDKDAQKHFTEIASVVGDESRTVHAGHGQSVETAKFRIGDYEWCEPDYRQILLWAAALKMEPAMLIEKLVAGKDSGQVATRFQDGRMLSLSWNLAELPILDFKCVEGITIEKLLLYSPFVVEPKKTENREILLRMPNLAILLCEGCEIKVLTLSCVPKLVELICGFNDLTELDLSNVPNLTTLFCNQNQIAKLDLSFVPKLAELWCNNNQLTDLDLSSVPNLTTLWCNENALTKLDIAYCQKIKVLNCWKNQLDDLVLSHVPNLTELYCDNNDLVELNLSKVPNLTTLCCSSTLLIQLDLSGVPNLDSLLCDNNGLTDLDISHVQNLTDLSCSNNGLWELHLSNVPKLTTLRCGGNVFSELDIRPLLSLETLDFDAGSTRLIQRPDQNF